MTKEIDPQASWSVDKTHHPLFSVSHYTNKRYKSPATQPSTNHSARYVAFGHIPYNRQGFRALNVNCSFTPAGLFDTVELLPW